MEEKGVIEKIINKKKGLYLVKLREEEDEICHTCPLSKLCDTSQRKIVAYSPIKLKENDKVGIKIIERNEAKGFAIIFLLPLFVSLITASIIHFLFSKDILTLISFVISIPLTIIFISKKINYQYIAEITGKKN